MMGLSAVSLSVGINFCRWRKLTIFSVQIFDLVHVLPFTDYCVVVEHVAICEGGEFGSGKFGILAEVETVDGDSDEVENTTKDYDRNLGGQGPLSK